MRQATRIDSAPRRTRISLRALLFLTAVCALALTALSLNAKIASLALALTVVLSGLLAILCFPFRGRSRVREAFRAGFFVFLLAAAALLSLGPACWLMTAPAFKSFRSHSVMLTFLYAYRPVAINYAYAPEPIHGVALQYLQWWAADEGDVGDHGWGVRITIDGNMTVIGI